MRLRRGRDFAERELVAFVAGSAGYFAACACLDHNVHSWPGFGGALSEGRRKADGCRS